MLRKRNTLLICLFAMSGCVSAEPKPETLILPWSAEMASSEAPLPFLAKYKRDEKEIYYVAAEHANSVQHQTFQMIAKAAKVFKPEIYLVEGVESNKGLSPADIKTMALKDGASGMFKNGESAFTVQIAVKNKVPFMGLEPSNKDILEALKKEKYSALDMIHLYFLRQLPQWIRAGILNSSKIDKMYLDFATGLVQELGVNEAPTYGDFLMWYKLKNKETFSLKNLDSEKAAPLTPAVYFTQKLSSAIGRVRDRHMIRIIENEYRSKNRVFVVLGGSHWMTQKLALEALSGFPSFEYKSN